MARTSRFVIGTCTLYITIHSTVNYTQTHTIYILEDMVICKILNITVQHCNGYTTQ